LIHVALPTSQSLTQSVSQPSQLPYLLAFVAHSSSQFGQRARDLAIKRV